MTSKNNSGEILPLSSKNQKFESLKFSFPFSTQSQVPKTILNSQEHNGQIVHSILNNENQNFSLQISDLFKQNYRSVPIIQGISSFFLSSFLFQFNTFFSFEIKTLNPSINKDNQM